MSETAWEHKKITESNQEDKTPSQIEMCESMIKKALIKRDKLWVGSLLSVLDTNNIELVLHEFNSNKKD
mgnify:CR=1 FL=1